ncbi:MAG: hypothetical protein ABR606_15755 [Vicinamibacterales bacterium]
MTIILVVPKLVGSIVLAIFTVLTSVDAVCCPDGCTDAEPMSESTQHSPDESTCVLCVGGIDVSVMPLLSACGRVSDDVVRLTFVAFPNITPDPLEHPPRI